MSAMIEFAPRKVADTEREKQLFELLNYAAVSLRNLGQEPALVAQCPLRFNDAHYADQWYAVQVGNAYWEQSHYLEDRTEPSIEQDGRDASSAPIEAAKQVLQDLNDAGWRAQLDETYGGDITHSGDVVCLAIQYGQTWICSSATISDTNLVCALTDDGRLEHVACCERIDERIGGIRPILFESLRPDLWQFLSVSGRAYFKPSLIDPQAAAKLAAMLRDVAGDVEDVTTDRMLVVASGSSANGFGTLQEAYLHVGDVQGPPTTIVGKKHSPPARGTVTEDFATVSRAVARLEQEHWQSHISSAFGMAHRGEVLGLLIFAGEQYLLWEHTVFAVETETVRFLGLGDRPNVFNTEWLPTLYPTD